MEQNESARSKVTVLNQVNVAVFTEPVFAYWCQSQESLSAFKCPPSKDAEGSPTSGEHSSSHLYPLTGRQQLTEGRRASADER